MVHATLCMPTHSINHKLSTHSLSSRQRFACKVCTPVWPPRIGSVPAAVGAGVTRAPDPATVGAAASRSTTTRGPSHVQCISARMQSARGWARRGAMMLLQQQEVHSTGLPDTVHLVVCGRALCSGPAHCVSGGACPRPEGGQTSQTLSYDILLVLIVVTTSTVNRQHHPAQNGYSLYSHC